MTQEIELGKSLVRLNINPSKVTLSAQPLTKGLPPISTILSSSGMPPPTKSNSIMDDLYMITPEEKLSQLEKDEPEVAKATSISKFSEITTHKHDWTLNPEHTPNTEFTIKNFCVEEV